MHIFSAGPMCSLRRALLFWLVPLFLLVGLSCAVVSYWSYGRMVNGFMDEQMAQLGESIAAQTDRVTLPQVAPARVADGTYVAQLYDAQGVRLASASPQIDVGLVGTPGFHDMRVQGVSWRIYETGVVRAGGHRVQVLQSGKFRAHLAAGRAGAAIAPLLVLLPLAMALLWGFAAHLSREIRAISEQAALQDEHTIAELPLTRVPSEIAPLVVSFNGLLTRLQGAFATQRRFVQDAAHELRTPITAVALQLENVRCDLPAGACAQSFAQLEAGVGRAQRLVDQLLRLSRQEATAPERTTIDLHAQLHESIDGLIALADQRRIDLGLVAPDRALAPVALRCAASDLRSAVDNLIENALRHTPEGGVVDVHLRASGVDGAGAVIEVVDTGPGIPDDVLPRVFDRFFRVPGTTARGSGLGLSIAQSAAQRCGLRISLRNREDRSGLIARLETA